MYHDDELSGEGKSQQNVTILAYRVVRVVDGDRERIPESRGGLLEADAMPLGIHMRFCRVPFEVHDAAGNSRSARPRDRFRNRSPIVHFASQMPRDVASDFAEPAFRDIWQHLDTSEPDLGSGTARCGGSSPSSCTARRRRVRAITDSAREAIAVPCLATLVHLLNDGFQSR